MDPDQIVKSVLYFFIFHLFIVKISNASQESQNRSEIVYNIYNQSNSSLDVLPRPLNNETVIINKSLESKASQLKDDLTKFVEWIRSSDRLPLYKTTKLNLLREIEILRTCLSRKLTLDTFVEIDLRTTELKTHLNLLKENSTDRIDQITKLNDIILQLNNFKPHLSNMLETWRTEKIIASFKPLIDACVDEIKAYRFDSARKKLQEINHDQKINFIVKALHGLGEENFYTLLNFADSFNNDVENSLRFYEALHHEINPTSQESLFKLLLLLRRLRSHMSRNRSNQMQINTEDDRNGSRALKTRVESLLNILKNSTRSAAIEEITDAFILDYLAKVEPHIFELAETGIFNMNTLIELVMDRISQKMATKHLSGIIRANKGLCVNETSSTPLSFRLKRMLSWSKYCTLSQDVKKLAQRAMNSSPVSIGLGPIEYCEKVCIMNVNYNEYLYDSDTSECSNKSNDNVSCPAYTTNLKSTGKTNQLAWNLKSTGTNKFQIISYKNNYTLFVNDQKWDEERRSVSTRQISQDGDKYEWQFESDGDFVYIKNIHYKEYLSASIIGYINNVTTIDLKSMVITSKRLRNVFTFIHKKLTPDCYWTIVECP